MPVYGVLYGVFTVTRELKANEVSRLKQDVFTLENDIKAAGAEGSDCLKPRLLNKYFWLADYYEAVGDTAARDTMMRKIKLLDPFIYERWTA
jgi:hypothetical protein